MIQDVDKWVSELKAAGWARHATFSTTWIAPWGAWYRGPLRAWQIMKGERPESNGPCPKPPRTEPSGARPVYSKFPQDKPNPEGTQLYGISCNEGWREHIVCTDMYEWSADWLLGVLGRTPYAREERHDI